MLGYAPDEVAEASGISVARIAEIEGGVVQPSGDEVLILASFYRCNFRSFLDDARPPPIQQTEILFRRFGDVFSAVDRRAVQEFLYLCEAEAELQKQLCISLKSFAYQPNGTFYKGHGLDAAERLRQLFGYSDRQVPRDVYDDFRQIGIHVFRRKLDNQEISGLYVNHPIAGNCVLINYNEDVYRQRFSVAHEVAHAIFDSGEEAMVTYIATSGKYSREDLKEIRANSFASGYLMPPSTLKLLTPWSVESALHWANEFRVSTAALAKALKDANLITEDLAKQIRSLRVSLHEKIDPELSSSFSDAQRVRRTGLLERGLSTYYVHLAFGAYDRGLVSTGRLAECLRVDWSDLVDVAALFGRSLKHGD